VVRRASKLQRHRSRRVVWVFSRARYAQAWRCIYWVLRPQKKKKRSWNMHLKTEKKCGDWWGDIGVNHVLRVAWTN
jgi:hypothetical protein